MGRIDAVLPDYLEQRLRIEVVKRYGGRKGDLLKAVTEAVQLWLDKPVAEKLSEAVRKEYNKNSRTQRKSLETLGKMGQSALPFLSEIASDTLVADPIREAALDYINTIQGARLARVREDLDPALVAEGKDSS